MSDAAPIEHPGWLTGGDFTEADEPLRLFAAWFAEAKRAEPVNPDAMALATVDADGLPNARMVLLKGFDERGFVFYTNLDSVKGHELAEAPKAALTFYWKSLQRQVRVRGSVEPVSAAEADAYFATRSRMAQIGAWASKQSAALESRMAFEKAVARLHGEIRHRRRAAAAALVGLSRGAAGNRVLAGAAVSAARPHRVHARERDAHRGARRGFIHEHDYDRKRQMPTEQPAAPDAAPHRGEPRHRPCDRQALLRRRLARHHLLAPPVPGELSVGSRTRGPHPGRSGGSREHRRGDRRDQASGSTASCMRSSTTPRSHPRRTAASGSARSTPRATIGITSSR